MGAGGADTNIQSLIVCSCPEGKTKYVQKVLKTYTFVQNNCAKDGVIASREGPPYPTLALSWKVSLLLKTGSSCWRSSKCYRTQVGVPDAQ